jgi:hypothetical protein
MDPKEWQSDYSLICPVCQIRRGAHYNGYCPRPDGLPPSTKVVPVGQTFELVPISGPDQPRGRWGIPIIYGNAPIAQTKNKDSNGLVNNHVCPTCKCDRVSKVEKSCWRCGGKL